MKARRLSDESDLAHWLRAGTELTRLTIDSDEVGRPLDRWVEELSRESPVLPPPGFIMDIGQLLSGRPLEITPLPHWLAPEQRRVLRRYEDHLLGRFAESKRLGDARQAFASLPERLRPRGLGVFLASLLIKLEFRGGVEVPRALLRRAFLADHTMSVPLASHSPKMNEERAHLIDDYAALADSVDVVAKLIDDADIFTLENSHLLARLSQRLAARQALQARQWFGENLTQLRLTHRKHRGATPTELTSEGCYPAGGYSALTRSGNLENITPSELAFMSETDKVELGGIDLFDVRFAENELLHYERDESYLIRPRRYIAFLLEPSLAAARLKDPGLRWQRVTCLIGLILFLLQRLSEQLGQEDLDVELCFLRPQAGAARGPRAERELCRLLARPWLERGLLTIESSTQENAESRLTELSEKAELSVITCRAIEQDDVQGDEPARSGRRALLDISGPQPKLFTKERKQDTKTTLDPAEAWLELGEQLFEWS